MFFTFCWKLGFIHLMAFECHDVSFPLLHVLEVVHFQLIIDQLDHFFSEFLSLTFRLFRVVFERTLQIFPKYHHKYSYCLLTDFWYSSIFLLPNSLSALHIILGSSFYREAWVTMALREISRQLEVDSSSGSIHFYWNIIIPDINESNSCPYPLWKRTQHRG